jgi:hypothetical protein
MKKLFASVLLLLSMAGFGQQHYPLKNMFGVNVHAWDIDSTYWPLQYKAFVEAGFSFIRIYSDVYAGKDEGNGFALNPDLRGFNSDSSLKMLKRDVPGLKTIFCWQNQPKSVQATWPQASTIYRPYNLSPDDTASYADIRKDAFVLASRGGTNKNVPDYKLFVSQYWWEPKQTMYKGAGIYDMLELMNEPDMEYTFGRLSGAQVAIANSATYDGAKAADPNIKVSSSGIANGSVAMFDSVAAWSVKNRGGKLPFDFYQCHMYAFAWNYGLAGGIPPEFELLPNAVQVAEHAAKFNTPVIIGEYGYDKHYKSYLGAPKFSLNQYDQNHSQAFMSLRAAICFSRAGMYAATYYRAFYDNNINAYADNENLFASTAFFTDVNQDNKIIIRQLHCDYQKQMSAGFGEYVYKDFQRDDTVKMYHFTYGAKEMLACWTYEKLSSYQDTDFYHTGRPLLIERKVNINFPKGTIYSFSDDGSGVMTQSKHPGGAITLTSKPFFFVADLTILPVRDPVVVLRPTVPVLYTVEVYNSIGQLLMKKSNVQLNQVKEQLQKNRIYILKYYNSKIFKTEKYIKTW